VLPRVVQRVYFARASSLPKITGYALAVLGTFSFFWRRTQGRPA